MGYFHLNLPQCLQIRLTLPQNLHVQALLPAYRGTTRLWARGTWGESLSVNHHFVPNLEVPSQPYLGRVHGAMLITPYNRAETGA